MNNDSNEIPQNFASYSKVPIYIFKTVNSLEFEIYLLEKTGSISPAIKLMQDMEESLRYEAKAPQFITCTFEGTQIFTFELFREVTEGMLITREYQYVSGME